MSDARTNLIRSYIERGWQPIHLPARSKNPGFDQWQRFTCTVDEVERYFPANRNVGMLLGKPSNGLVDVDLDSPEAISLARQFLPRTEMIHGRAGKPLSHWWYVCTDHTPEQVRRFKDVDGTTICELRSTGGQTIVPPSTHETGEAITWASEGDPAEVDGRELESAVMRLAACAVLARHWPTGSRHDVALALAGALLRHGWDTDSATAFIVAAARVAGDPELADRERAIHDTADALRRGKAATGIPSLVTILGKNVVDQLFKILGLTERVEAQPLDIEHVVQPITAPDDDANSNEWRTILEDIDIPFGALPYWMTRLVTYMRPLTPMFPGEDWSLMMGLPFWSSLWSGVRLQNLNLAIWSLGVSPQGVGKNVSTDELLRIARGATGRTNQTPAIYTMGSPEGMWDTLSGDGKQMLCYHDEFGGYLKNLQRDHMQSARESLCSLYDGRVVGYLRAQKNGVEITNPHVVVAATTTPSSVRDFVTRQDMTNGYLSRFMICAPDPMSQSPDFSGISDFERDELLRELNEHLRTYRNATNVVWQETGRKDPPMMDTYREHLGINDGTIINLDESNDDTAIPAGRLVARTKKIAALLELAEQFPEMTENNTVFAVRTEHLETAIKLVERSRAYAERLRGWVGESQDVDLSRKAYAYIVRHKAISQRDLCRYMKVNVKQVRDALELLEGAGMAHPHRNGKVVVWVPGQERAA